MDTTLYLTLTMTSDYYTSAVDEILCKDNNQIFLKPSTSYYIAKKS